MEEKIARLQKVVAEIGVLTQEIGPKLIRLAHLRKEARLILAEIAPEGAPDSDIAEGA